MRRSVLFVISLAVVGCSPTAAPVSTTTSQSLPTTAVTTTTVAAPATSSTTPAIEPMIPEGLGDFELGTVILDGLELQIVIADESDERRRGLMGVTDLLSLDGMLFVFPADTTSGFWMKNTLIPLDIAFFTADGGYVDSFTMEPCTNDPCPTYQPDGPYRYALEMAAGTLPNNVTQLDF